LIEAVVLATNSTATVTTTVSQQTTGISILGLPLTDWITAGATLVLALYAAVTIHEGRKARCLDEYDKELVNLFNPMADILSRTEGYTDPFVVTYATGESYVGSYQKFLETDVKNLREIFVKYGHYLAGLRYHDIKSLLFFNKSLDSRYLIFPKDERTARMCGLAEDANWTVCFVAIDVRRQQLIGECIKLQRGWLWRILHSGFWS
jgi:hypothetical protein